MFNKKLWQVLILIFWLTNNRTRIKIKSGIRIWVRIRTFRIGHTVNSLFKRVVFEMTYPLVQAQLLPAPVVEGWLRSCQGYHQHWREPTVQLRGRQGYAVLAALFFWLEPERLRRGASGFSCILFTYRYMTKNRSICTYTYPIAENYFIYLLNYQQISIEIILICSSSRSRRR